MNKHHHHPALPLAAIALATMALVGCGRDDRAIEDDRAISSAARDTAAQQAPVVQAERSGDTAGAKIDRGMAATRDAAHDAKVASEKTANDVGDKVSDAVITTSVNAELAKDDKLSALKINVDTSEGRVMLKGTAPSAADKDRATQLAQSVKGVTGVDNQLRVEPS